MLTIRVCWVVFCSIMDALLRNHDSQVIRNFLHILLLISKGIALIYSTSTLCLFVNVEVRAQSLLPQNHHAFSLL